VPDSEPVLIAIAVAATPAGCVADRGCKRGAK
jgi:hypothetical protein